MFFTPSAATALATSHEHHSPGSLQRSVTLHGFFLHILKSVLNTARLSETPILPCSEVSVSLYCAVKTAQVTGMASGLTPTVVPLPSLLLFKQNAYMPHSEPLLLWDPLSGCSLCLWSFTQFRPSLNSSFIEIAYPVTAAYHRKAPHS